MDIIIVTRIYDEIIEYYNSIEFENLELDDLNDYPYIDTAYRQYDLENQMENINAPESLKRYLIKHFAYLMKNVFYLDMKKFKAKGAKGSYFVYTKDSPIIKEILLRSVSQNEHDVIIGRWLEGKIKDDSYYELVELSERLFQLIQQTDTVKQDVKNQWITALKISLQTEFAYTMTEMEFIVRQLFSFSLPFEYAENNEVSKSKGKSVSHSYNSQSILSYLEETDKNAQENILEVVYSYLNSIDLNKISPTESFPPVELLQLKSVCEFLYQHDWLEIMPNADKIDKYIKYFISIDKTYQKRLENRKQLDRKRYQQRKQKRT